MTDFIDRDEMRRRLNKCPSDEITAAFEILDAMPTLSCETCRPDCSIRHAHEQHWNHSGGRLPVDFSCSEWAERREP